MDNRIEILVGDITRLEVEAIVNAANTRLAGGGGVDGAIHRAAGPELKQACAEIGGCPTGEARITPGFQLPARWIIHTVGPVWNGGEQGEPEMLERCYRNSFDLAREHGIRSLAFPGISTGVYGFPKERAAHIALAIMNQNQHDFDRIIACGFSESDAEVYRAARDALPRRT